MKVASASKWIYGSFVVEKNSPLSDADVQALTMRAGYTSFSYDACELIKGSTVQNCFTIAKNDVLSPGEVGKFHYDGGNFQYHAVKQMNLGPLADGDLSNTINQGLRLNDSISYDSPQLAAGVETTPKTYRSFLQAILAKRLKISSVLGSNAVCTNPKTCPTSSYTPVPDTESWSYSLGHWVENDPAVGDGSFSSPGAFGFYPWVDASVRYYGILARYKIGPGGMGSDSVACGRLIRQAWITGKSVNGTVPTGSSSTTGSGQGGKSHALSYSASLAAQIIAGLLLYCL
ncbi:hypothetical protein HDU91_006779 [Kappamyces sp. JEL0680]|nr:hypothetical protein HDU91_006779 [Kappamyces sp. JEL0680]